MNRNDFERLIGQLLADVLVPHGFACEKSSHAIFYREISKDIFHFVGPDFRSRGQWFDLKVFPSSPRIDPMFVSRFPDALGIPTDTYCFLNKWTGVGSEHQSFKCEAPEQVRHTFETEIKSLLLSKALPYLDRIQSVVTMLPLIRSKLFQGFALSEIGETAAAQPIMRAERLRLEKVRESNPGNRDVEIMIDRLDHLLKL